VRSHIASMCPFFIVSSVERSMAFYEKKLGFNVQFQQPDPDPFFSIVGRDDAMLFLKSGSAAPQPNSSRDPAMRWDAYCSMPDPDALATEFAGRGTSFSNPLKDTGDGLRGFEITHPDGYVLFFGRPR
jgi:predicted enzyme related to lactoylglutathione lyase